MPPQKTLISLSTGSIIRAVAIIVLCVVVFWVRDVILAVLVSVVVASAIEPAVRFLMKYKIPRTGAVLSIYAALAIILGLVVYFVLPVLFNEVVSLLKTLPTLLDSLGNSATTAIPDSQSTLSVVSTTNQLSSYISDIASTLGGLGGGSPIQLGSYVFGGLSLFGIIFVLSFYLSAQQDGVGDFLRIVTPLEHEAYVIGLWRRVQRNISRWMQGQVVLGVMVGFFVYIGLAILGIRHALLLALISAIFEIIPVFGPILGAIPGIIIGFIDGGVGLALLVAALYVIIQQLESNVIYPLVVKKVVGVHPIVVIISLLIGITLGGFLGAILSIPLATVAIEFLNDWEKSRRATT